MTRSIPTERMLRVCRLGWQLGRHLHTSPSAPAIQLLMPSLSPTMEEGTIVKWLKVGGLIGSVTSL